MPKTLARILTVALLVTACTDEAAARRTLDDMGYENIEITGYDAWRCGRDEDTATAFRATNAKGKRVSGVVCCGWYSKGCTVRF